MNTTTEVEIVAPVAPGDPHMKQIVVWDDFRAEANRLKATAETLTVTNVSQVAEMKLARATRLTIKNLRVAITKKHTELKASVLEEGRKIDAGKNELLKILEPLEDRLLLQENFAEREAARLKAEKHNARVAQLNPYLSSPVIIAEMSEEDFAAALESAKSVHEHKLAQAKKEQEAREEAARQEQQRIAAQRIENERLRAELAEQKRIADEAAAKIRAEREEIAALQRKALEQAAAVAKKAEDERKALQARIDAEIAEQKKKEDEERKAAEAALLAPDQQKLKAYAMALWEVPQPKVASERGKQAALDIRRNLERFIAYIENAAQDL